MLKKTVFAAMMVLLLSPVSAQAETFVWKDVKGDFTMSYPDTWRVQTQDTPSTYLRIAGPVAAERPTCRMQVVDDGRAQIYPKNLMDRANAHFLNESFYEDELAQYADMRLTAFYAPASMGGQGDATAARYVFREQGQAMYGFMLASLYGGKRYMASCSARADAYGRWMPVFASILGSIELKDKYNPFATGYYRDFLADPDLVLPRTKPGTTHKNTFDIKHHQMYR